ncbi:N-acetylmuramoyl-L-alanine amidase [Rufibacter soli]
MKIKYKYLMLHCSANTEGSKLTGKDIAAYHTNPVAKGGRGWKVPGYSRVIRVDGTVDKLRDNNEDAWVDAGEITNGATGFNSNTRHICYIGGLDKKMNAKDTRTAAQKEALKKEVLQILRVCPDIKILGHGQVAPKACPSFHVPTWLREIGVPEKNIY